MSQYNLILKNENSTIVAEYIPVKTQSASYQSEADLEKAFIDLLESQAYEYKKINNEQDLILNLRKQLEKLNDYSFTDREWDQLFKNDLVNKAEGIEEKAAKIQEDHIRLLKLDNGQTKNIQLIDKTNIHNNSLQVINQYEAEGSRSNRYDVTILVNGLPLVHIELKRRGVALKEAFNQINRYKRESFWSGSGLFEYVQLFVISNGTHTKYYSNTTRDRHTQPRQSNKRNTKKTSHSFEFTSWWADAKNKPIPDLMDFVRTFFAKHSILNILTRYCVFTSDRSLLVMRPYQIAATERILNVIEIATNYKKLGKLEAGGYVWHTTGSGKTLTSFKTAQLASRLTYVDKVLFVVDRKDLDYQTMAEYDKFEKGAANSNTSTAKLRKQLKDPDCRIIITTIQKLDRFIKQDSNKEVLNLKIVLIFDECHRSQFGGMHRAITKNFKNYYLFGFTGTPIFAKNASGSELNLKTTEQIFGKQLHSYTIVDAINDGNVLPFKLDYVRTIQAKGDDEIDDAQIRSIDREKAFADPKRISNIVQYIRKHFNQKTKRRNQYIFDKLTDISQVATTRNRSNTKEKKIVTHLSGFNSIFAVSSIAFAKKYYFEFQKQQLNETDVNKIKVAIIFSYSPNEPEADLESLEEENPETLGGLDQDSRDFLDKAIKDYNEMFSTNYDTSSEKFQNYYRDVSLRMKNKEIDLLIVVNMFLTGFDATTLNTLWVDKNLRMHGLLQAYSRTNRILNSIKTFGNIVTFRNLEKATNEALSLFGDKDASGIVLIKTFAEYYQGYELEGKKIKGYSELINELTTKFPKDQPILGEENEKEFIRLYGSILRLVNILNTFDDFKGQEILNNREMQDYQSIYLDLHDKFRKSEDGDKENINDNLIFEIELVKQVEVNIDYILRLIYKHHKANTESKELPIEVVRAIDSSVGLRNKKDLIKQFVAQLSPDLTVEEAWQVFVRESQIEELDKIIEQEDLDRLKTYSFINNSFKDGVVQVEGTALAEILPPISRFDPDQMRAKAKQRVLNKLLSFFERFFDISKDSLK